MATKKLKQVLLLVPLISFPFWLWAIISWDLPVMWGIVGISNASFLASATIPSQKDTFPYLKDFYESGGIEEYIQWLDSLTDEELDQLIDKLS